MDGLDICPIYVVSGLPLRNGRVSLIERPKLKVLKDSRLNLKCERRQYFAGQHLVKMSVSI